jgi:hypothetical protein
VNRYGIVATDHFGGFTWGDTVPDKVADRLVQFILDIFVKGGYGAPEIVLSDNGGEVTNKIIKSMK